jgi:hypothetical protein
MKAKALLTVAAAILLAGCSLRGKPAKSAVVPAAPKPVVAPAPAPPPPAALHPPDPCGTAEAAARGSRGPRHRTKPPEPPEPPPAAGTRPPAAHQPGREPAASPAAAPRPPPAAPPETRETFQEIVSPAELKRLQDQALARRREANQILDQLGRRQLTGAEQTWPLPSGISWRSPKKPRSTTTRARRIPWPSGPRSSPRNCRVENSQYEERRQRVAAGLPERKLDCLLVAFSPNLRYLSGFTGSNGAC